MSSPPKWVVNGRAVPAARGRGFRLTGGDEPSVSRLGGNRPRVPAARCRRRRRPRAPGRGGPSPTSSPRPPNGPARPGPGARAVIAVESGCRATAQSPAGAGGCSRCRARSTTSASQAPSIPAERRRWRRLPAPPHRRARDRARTGRLQRRARRRAALQRHPAMRTDAGLRGRAVLDRGGPDCRRTERYTSCRIATRAST